MSSVAWLSIAAIERDTGLSKDLLRVWERRYGFPQPERDANGERLYPPEQLQRLRAIKRLLDAGLRPSQVVALEHPALEERLQQLQPAARSYDVGVDLDALLLPLLAHDPSRLHAALQAELLRRGLGPYVIELLAPLIRRVGELWAEGRVQIHEEHLFTEVVQQQLRRAIAALSAEDTARPRVVLSTLPGEEHGLGLLMVHALLALEGCACVSLGLQTPGAELVTACERQKADVLALSCSAYARNAGLQQDILRLRELLPSGTQLWLGGSAPALRRLPAAVGLVVVTDLQGIAQTVGRWRAG
jgi:MerR family transcriptional regulator, light-induced transcriptional regulator